MHYYEVQDAKNRMTSEKLMMGHMADDGSGNCDAKATITTGVGDTDSESECTRQQQLKLRCLITLFACQNAAIERSEVGKGSAKFRQIRSKPANLSKVKPFCTIFEAQASNIYEPHVFG